MDLRLILIAMTNVITDLSASQLRQAAALKERIEKLQNALGRIIGNHQTRNGGTSPKKGTMSAAGRARIAAAARARWAKQRGQASSKSAKSGKKMSAAAKTHLAAIARARWKKAKAAGRNAL